MGSQITRALGRSSRQTPYRGNEQAAKEVIKMMSIVMSLIAIGCVGFISGQETTLNAHTYILIISILSLGINKTTNVFVFLLSTIFFVVGGLFFSHLTFLFETVKLGMILSTSSNVLNYYKNQYVCSLYLWISFYIYSSLVCLSKSLKLIRLQTSNIDSDMAHKLGIRIFIIALCAGCVFLIIMGHRHIRRFIHKPLKFNQYFKKVTKILNFKTAILCLCLWAYNTIENTFTNLHYNYKILSIVFAFAMYYALSVFNINKKKGMVITLLCTAFILLYFVLPQAISFIIVVLINLYFIEQVSKVSTQRGSIGIGLVLLSHSLSLCTHQHLEIAETNILYFLVFGFFTAIIYFLIQFKMEKTIYQSVPQ